MIQSLTMLIVASTICRYLSGGFLVKQSLPIVTRNFAIPVSHGKSNSKAPRPPAPVTCGEEMELYIDDLSNLGLGVGRKLHNGANWVIMVPLVLPGETVKIIIKRNLATYSEADLLEVITPSNDRVAPPCKYFSVCGGCQYQHMNITAQRKWKTKQVSAALQRIAKLGNISVRDTVGSEHTFKYRSKLTPHCVNITTTDNTGKSTGESLVFGFQKRATNEIVDVDHCLVASDGINNEYGKVRASLISGGVANNVDSTLLFRETVGGVTSDAHEMVSHTVHDITFQFKAGEFFQNNPHVLPLLVQHVVYQAAGGGCEFLIDAYCGSGLFALSAAQRFKKVLGIEISQASINAAVANACNNNIQNAEFTRGEAQHIFKQAKSLPAAKTVVVLDPPRRGCDVVFLQQLIAFAPRRIVYVSCEPTTQARDAQRLVQAGYQIVDVTPFDLFPQTRHIETIITFVKVCE